MSTVVYLNGEFVPPDEARVSIFDHGYLFGDGLFDTQRSYAGIFFRFSDHLERFYDAAHFLRIEVPVPSAELEHLCYTALERSELDDAYLRITLSRGVGERGIDPDLCGDPTLSLIVKEVPRYPDEYYATGIQTGIATTSTATGSSGTARIKSANYQTHILAKQEMNQRGFLEGFLLNPQGHVAEGTVSNVFVAKGRALLTPDLTSGCLPGITRKVVLEIARREADIEVRETQLDRYDLYTADECFVTNSLMELLPVAAVDGRPIGDGKPGSLTQRLHGRYVALTREARRT